MGTVSGAHIYNLTYTASSAGASKSALGTLLKRAVEAGDGALSAVQFVQVEKTGQQYEMTLLVQ